MLAFDFKSTSQGEIHGIGLDADLESDINTIFKLYGTQTYGLTNFDDYAASAPNWKHYEIPIGQYYTGEHLYLFFANDHDIASPTAESYFSNIALFNQPPTASPTSTPTATATFTPTFTHTPTHTSTAIATSTFTPTVTSTFAPTATSTPVNGYTYDRTAAIAYADQWAHEPRNTNYPLSGETGCNCNDCTNYISQVLHNGGYPLRSGNWNENSVFEWWYRDGILFQPDYSKTWSVTDWLNTYFAQYPNEFDVVSSVSTLEGGDVILLDLRNNDTNAPIPDGKPDHGRVIVGYGYTSTNQDDYTDGCGNNLSVPASEYVLLANQHCTDRWHVVWNYNIQDVPRWYIHVID